MNTTTQAGTVYRIDFGAGRLVPVRNAGTIPIGSVVSYRDCANPLRQAVVIGEFERLGQRCMFEDGHGSTVSRDAINGPGGWHIVEKDGVPLILNDEERKAFLATAKAEGVRLETEQKIASDRAAEQSAKTRADYLNRFPYLERAEGSKKSSHALGSSNLRKELARTFPGVKFSVRSESYSGGDSIDVRWELGPTTAQVKAVTDKYQEGNFNGMEDIYETDHDNCWPHIFGGAKYVGEERGEGEAWTSELTDNEYTAWDKYADSHPWLFTRDKYEPVLAMFLSHYRRGIDLNAV